MLLAGCGPLRPAQSLPTGFELSQGPIVIHSDQPVERQAAELPDLGQLQTRLNVALGGGPDPVAIDVYLFPSRDQLRNYLATRLPELQTRRAVFIKTAAGSTILACNGSHLATDLRHELTHAWLHQRSGQFPLWVDEGLAEYFETEPPGDHLGQPEHVRLLQEALASGAWQPDLNRLATKDRVESMSRLDYAEAWLWTCWILDHAPPEVSGRWRSWWQSPVAERGSLTATLLSAIPPGQEPWHWFEQQIMGLRLAGRQRQ